MLKEEEKQLLETIIREYPERTKLQQELQKLLDRILDDIIDREVTESEGKT